MKTWFAEYRRLMASTSLVSLFPTFLICCVALFENIRFWTIFCDQSSMPTDLLVVFLKATLLKLLVVIAFAYRFYILRKRDSLKYRTILLSWLAACSSGILYWLDSVDFGFRSHNPFTIYSFEPADPLETVWFTYLFFSLVRFGITALWAFLKFR